MAVAFPPLHLSLLNKRRKRLQRPWRCCSSCAIAICTPSFLKRQVHVTQCVRHTHSFEGHRQRMCARVRELAVKALEYPSLVQVALPNPQQPPVSRAHSIPCVTTNCYNLPLTHPCPAVCLTPCSCPRSLRCRTWRDRNVAGNARGPRLQRVEAASRVIVGAHKFAISDSAF